MTCEKRAVLVVESFMAQLFTARLLRLRSLRVAPHQKKSARELRQEGSDYRCCIPALAGFVSPQSIAPDGGQIFIEH
jgi:hypothetical protein